MTTRLHGGGCPPAQAPARPSSVRALQKYGRDGRPGCACGATAAPQESRALSDIQVGEGVARVAVLGASGYTGAEVVRLGALHPNLKIAALTADRQAGKAFSDVFPHLVTATDVPELAKIDDVDFHNIDAAFCCLPHATTQKIIASLPPSIRVVDLSADFRLRDTATYKEWYGGDHQAPELQKEAVYGLTEIFRSAIQSARLVANPGCYPTSICLPLFPLLQQQLVQKDGIIIDAKSGVTGAGRSPAESKLFCEVADGMHAYGVSSHRHMPEIEQCLSDAAGFPVRVSFTPHLVPMSRGMMSTIYVQMSEGVTANTLRSALQHFYDAEPFVKVLPAGTFPQTRHVRGSNLNLIGVSEDRLSGRAIILSVIDNLVKGASGQAIQNMNLVLGVDETTGLMQQPLFP
ncbi:unnamed protein product [Ostreobium quekettii]|uniref:Probable N-acetyl-gamma-glutamyl-phosphate reductase, chloroplastic n=1 Tax=Ostreobium quekettii TaxID=121088 RepID=A0A8S1IS90_9CHLO|nr:unnamed protein product [Ostreobium quekettii]|eukprot:evm.model.scf_68EXC.4 EVM.evm.TU.scf_68EXC.4   scf_68EXC:59205-64182(-)